MADTEPGPIAKAIAAIGARATGIARGADIMKRIDALNARLDAINKEGEASGPTADGVHVPSTDWGKRPKKKPKPAKAEAKN